MKIGIGFTDFLLNPPLLKVKKVVSDKSQKVNQKKAVRILRLLQVRTTFFVQSCEVNFDEQLLDQKDKNVL
jgi:hypothetical protein